MDLESMKRRDLQRLCRKHGISSNSTNSAMIESLRSIFQKQKNSKPKGCLKGSGGSNGEGPKKVTFVLEDEEEEEVEVLEFGGEHGGRSSRRRSRVPDAPVRSMRSRGLAESVLWSPVIEKKRARVGKQAVCGNSEEEVLTTTRSLRNRVVEVGGEEQVVRGKRPRDVSEAVGQKKKLKKQAKDGEAVAQAVRRTTRSSSGLSDKEASSDGETTLEEPSKGVKVTKLAPEPVRLSTCSTSSSQEEPYDCKTAVKDKHVKQVKTRDSEVVTEPVRRLTRSSVNLGGDEVGKLGGEAVRKGKTKRQAKAHVPRGESAVPVSDTEAVIPSTRRSTRSSFKLLDDDIPSLGVGKPRKQGKKHVSRSGDSEVSVSDSEAVISPTKRTTRSSPRLLEDEISLPAVGKPMQQAKKHVSRRGDLEVTVLDTESVISPMRRTTRSSSVLLEDEKSLPECGKTQQQAKKHVLSRGQSNVSGSNSEAVISPTKISTRNSSKMLADESSLLVVGKLGAEAVRNKSGKQAKKEGVSKASMSESEAVNAPTRRTTRSSSLEDGASLPVRGKFSVDTEAVKYKSGKQAKNHASNQGVSSALVQDSKFVSQSTRRSAHNSSMLGKSEVDNKAVRGDKPSKQSKKRASKRETLIASLADSNSVAQSARRSSRSSPLYDSLGDGSYLPLGRKLDHDGEAVYTDKSEKQVRSLRSRKGDESAQEISLSVGGDSVNKAKIGKRKKIQKQHGDQDLKEEASKASVSDSKRGAELEGPEVPKIIDEPPRRTTRSASKHGESLIMPVGVTASDIVVETSSKKKRTRAGDLENVSVGMRETVELGSLGIIHNAGSRKSSRKSLRNVPTESETVQRESSPETAVRLLEETAKASSVKFRTPGKQISSYKQLSSILETEDVQTLTSSENHEKNDHNIVDGDKAKALELHEVMHTAENVPLPFSGPTPSIDLSVAGETDDAGNEVHDVNEKNVSELPSSPAPIKLLEAEKGTALEGSSNINQSSRVQEWHDERTSSVNHETDDHNIVSGNVVEGSVFHEVVNGSENVSLPESSSGALSVDLFIAGETDGAEIEVNDVIEGNYSQLQQSPVTDQSQEVEKGILLDGPINSEQQSLKQGLKVDEKVSSSGSQDLEDHSIVGKDQAEVAEAHKAIPIVEIETNVVTEKSMPEVDRSPVSIQLQEVENILSFEGARNASTIDCHSCDPSIFSSGNHYKTVDDTSLVADSDTGEIPNLRRVSHIEMEGSGADLDGEPEKVAKETPVVGSRSHLSDGCVEEVKETCQSPTLFLAENDGEKAEAEVPPSSRSDSTSFGLRLGEQVTDHGTQQAGIDCGSYMVSKETACDSDPTLSGAATAEAKGVCLIPILSLLESDGAGTVGNQVNGEIGESRFHSEDVKSTAYSVISKGMGALADAILCGDNEKVVEAKNTPAVHLRNSGEGDAAEFSSSIAMAGEVFSDQSRAVNLAHFVNDNNSGDVTKGAIETEDVSLVGTTEASSLPYSEACDAPSRTNDVEKVVHDYPSSARGPGGLDGEAIMHSDQQRNPGDSSPDLASANYEVDPQVTVGPTHELLDAKVKRNLGLTDVVVEEIESRESLKGEASDDCEDLSVKELDITVENKFEETILEQGDAYVEKIESRGSLKGEASDDCEDLSVKEVDTTVVVKFDETILEQGDAYVEEIDSRESLKGEASDDCEDLSVKEHDTAVVDKFGETILEQGDASELQVPLETSREPKASDFSSHGTFETPECQDSSPSERVLPVEDFSLSEKVENEHVDKENAQGTSAEEKMVKEENNTEDDTITVKEDNISVDEFDEVREQCGAFFLAPFNSVVLQCAEDASSAHIETPASQDSATLRNENFSLERPGSVEEPAGERVVLSPIPVSKLDTEKAVQEKSETGILCNAHAVEEQEDRLGVTRDADEDVSQTKAESLLEASVNIEEPIFCSTSGSKYSKSVDTFQCEGAGVYEKSTHLYLNSIEKAPHCTGQSLVVGQQEQITAGIEGDSSIKNESYTNYKVDIPMPGMNQDDTEIGIHEVEKLPPNSGESLVGNQDLTSIETEEVSAIEVGKASPQYISVGTKELSAIEDEKSSPTSVPSLVGQQVQTSMDIQGFSATGTNDRVEKAPVVKDNMTLLFTPFHYNPQEDASTGYTERSEDKLDSWVFGDMTDVMDLTEVSDGLNYRAARQDEVGVSNKHQGEFNRFEQSPVSRSVQPRAEEAGPSPMYLDDLFCMDDEGTHILDDSGHVDQWENRLDEEKSHFNEDENYLEVNSMKEAGERKEMKSMCFSRNFEAERKEALFFASESFAEAENISASHLVQEGKSSGQGTNAVMKDEG